MVKPVNLYLDRKPGKSYRSSDVKYFKAKISLFNVLWIANSTALTLLLIEIVQVDGLSLSWQKDNTIIKNKQPKLYPNCNWDSDCPGDQICGQKSFIKPEVCILSRIELSNRGLECTGSTYRYKASDVKRKSRFLCM